LDLRQGVGDGILPRIPAPDDPNRTAEIFLGGERGNGNHFIRPRGDNEIGDRRTSREAVKRR